MKGSDPKAHVAFSFSALLSELTMWVLNGRTGVPNWGQFCPPETFGDVWRRFGLSNWERGALGISCPEPSDTNKHSTMDKTAPMTNNYPAWSITAVHWETPSRVANHFNELIALSQLRLYEVGLPSTKNVFPCGRSWEKQRTFQMVIKDHGKVFVDGRYTF